MLVVRLGKTNKDDGIVLFKCSLYDDSFLKRGGSKGTCEGGCFHAR